MSVSYSHLGTPPTSTTHSRATSPSPFIHNPADVIEDDDELAEACETLGEMGVKRRLTSNSPWTLSFDAQLLHLPDNTSRILRVFHPDHTTTKIKFSHTMTAQATAERGRKGSTGSGGAEDEWAVRIAEANSHSKDPNKQDDVIEISWVADNATGHAPRIEDVEGESDYLENRGRMWAKRLWITLYWYFSDTTNQPPLPRDAKCGAPRRPWRVGIVRNSILTAEVLEICVGSGIINDADTSAGNRSFTSCYASRTSFWQLSAPIFLSLIPNTRLDYTLPKIHFFKPAEYTVTANTRHPLRPKPFPLDGRAVYSRHIPTLSSFLSFRVASLSDVALVNKWMNSPRVNAFWGEAGDLAHTEKFLKQALSLQHSFPVIGMWDEQPFGYFEMYWVKEDLLGRYCDVGDWDRGVHCLVGEDRYRGPDRVAAWLGGLQHALFLGDQRTQAIYLEPRIDNEKFIRYLEVSGFYKQKVVDLPHKRSCIMKLERDGWEGPKC